MNQVLGGFLFLKTCWISELFVLSIIAEGCFFMTFNLIYHCLFQIHLANLIFPFFNIGATCERMRGQNAHGAWQDVHRHRRCQKESQKRQHGNSSW